MVCHRVVASDELSGLVAIALQVVLPQWSCPTTITSEPSVVVSAWSAWKVGEIPAVARPITVDVEPTTRSGVGDDVSAGFEVSDDAGTSVTRDPQAPSNSELSITSDHWADR